ncbi:MAG: acylneuraminate cytidylyltransferase family protein [Minisyncoccia bacterium]
MIGNLKVLAIVPARGNSTRIPRKNMRELAGKPLISYTFDEVKKSQYIDRTILISDSDEIGALAKASGVEWPFVEPADLADGSQPDLSFFLYALKWLREKENYTPDIIVQLRPTSPLRTVEHIDAAIELLIKHPDADSVRTVTEPEQSPYKMYKVSDIGLLEPLLRIEGEAESFNLPDARLPKAYKHVGYVDAIWGRTLERGEMTGKNVVPLVLENAYSGINVEKDWELYEFLMRKA